MSQLKPKKLSSETFQLHVQTYIIYNIFSFGGVRLAKSKPLQQISIAKYDSSLPAFTAE